MKLISLRLVTLSIMAVFLVSCYDQRDRLGGNGFLQVNGGKIWYKVIGDGEKTPVVLLHGGPGFPSHYLKPLAKLSVDRPVVMFDQLGCGRSDRISDTTLMTIDNHLDQLKRLVDFLGLEKFYLYGHSWGSMMAIDYYLKFPENIKALILASPCLNAKMWLQDADTLISTLPDSIRTVLQKTIAGQDQDSAALMSAVNYYAEKFISRKQPITADMDSSNIEMGYNVYHHMWGEFEFFATGTLKNYDRTGELARVSVPTLYTVGEFDEARPATVRYYHSLTPHSQFRMTPDAGHMTMQDNPAIDIKVISEFLGKIDGGDF